MNALQLEIIPDRPTSTARPVIDGETVPKHKSDLMVKKIGHRHHHLARCLASGMTRMEAALATGYCVGRITMLKNDPLFQDLMAFYQKTKQDVFVDTAQYLSDLTNEAINELRSRIDEAPEKISNKDLIKALQIASDRSGFGPTKTQQNINISLADKMREAKRRREAMDLESEVVNV